MGGGAKGPGKDLTLAQRQEIREGKFQQCAAVESRKWYKILFLFGNLRVCWVLSSKKIALGNTSTL